MSWGLLAGLGQGLSQGAQIVGQGMAEDRNAKREAEREAIAERRWRESFELQKQQAAEQKAFQRESFDFQKKQAADNKALQREQIDYARGRDKVGDERYEREQRLRQVENELNRIYQESREATQAVRQGFDSQIQALQKEQEALYRIRDAADPMAALGQVGEQTTVRSPAEVANRLKYIRESLTDLQEQRQQALIDLRNETRQTLTSVAGMYDPKVVDSSSFKGYVRSIEQQLADVAAGNPPKQDTLPSFVVDVLGESLLDTPNPAKKPATKEMEPPKVVDPKAGGFIPGVKAGFNAATANNGQGLLSNLMDQNSQYENENTSISGHILHPVGSLLGSAAGMGVNAVGSITDAGRILTESPAERQRRLNQQKTR